MAAALGAIIQAVVVPEGTSLGAALERAAGPIEALAQTPDGGDSGTKETAPPGAKDLWDVVEGPESILATLRRIIPRTYIVEEQGDGRGAIEALGASAGRSSVRVVNQRGELLEGGLYAARRHEAGAESLIAATNELAAAASEYATACEEREVARRTAEQAAAGSAGAESALRDLEEQVRQTEHSLASLRSEADLCRRRLEEAAVQLLEIQERGSREEGLSQELTEQLSSVEETMVARESELEQARASLRRVQSEMEGMRVTVTRLEDKKGQAALVEVKLRERCRTVASERARVQSHKETADKEVAKWQQRMAFLERCAPVVTALSKVSEELAERSRSASDRLQTSMESSRGETDGNAKTMRDWSSAEMELQREYDTLTDRLTEARVEQARCDDRRMQLEEELAELRRRHLAPRDLKPEDITGVDSETLAAAVERADRRRERIGPVNPLAEQEYGQMSERAQFLAEQREDLEAAVAQLQEVIAGLDVHIERSFNEVFEAARENFEQVISVVFPGAKGSLRLSEPKPSARSASPDEGEAIDLAEDDQGPAAKGVNIEVRFANKAPRTLSLLSGGEKAMTAVAFLFSLFLAKPCPFYILDEVEASLDDINIRRFLSLVQRYRDRTQFIIITHQRQTMEVADTLYGVALEPDGTSRVLSRKMALAQGA